MPGSKRSSCPTRSSRLAAGAALLAAWAAPAFAAPPEDLNDTNGSNIAAAAGTTKKKKDLVVAPIPQSNPTLGSGLAVVGALIYQPKGAPRPWTTGIGGLYMSSKSWGIGVLQRANFAGDRFRVAATLAYGDFNIDFYGVGSASGTGGPIEINQTGILAIADAQIRVAPALYAGIGYRLIDTTTTIDLATLPAFEATNVPSAQLRATASTAGPIMTYDTRDSEYAPRKGEFATVKYLRSFSAIGSDFEYGKLLAAASVYREIDSKSVVAARLSACSVDGEAPFFDICLFGAQNDLRGYPTGKYRDNGSFAAQAEYRRHLKGRFGGVVFAGVGGVSSALMDFGDYRILPSAGAGVRIAVSKDFGMNMSIDFAVGKNSKGLHVYVAEAF
jgi:hypothetical protein